MFIINPHRFAVAADFIFDVKTDNSGTSLTDEFQMPLMSAGTLNFTITHADLIGSPITITAFDDAATLLAFNTAGTKTGITCVANSGTSISGWDFNNGADKLKLLDISNCGQLDISEIGSFLGCSNLVWTATDAPLISTNNLTNTFRGCSLFNGKVENWPVDSVTMFVAFLRGAGVFNKPLFENTGSGTSFDSMLLNADTFDQNMGNMDISSLTTGANMMLNATGLSTVNYGLTLVGWEGQSHNSSVIVHFGGSTYSEGVVDSGTTDGTTANKLIDSTQNFLTTVTVGDAIHNTTDDTFALVSAVDSDTSLSLNADIMISGETYVVQGSAAAKARARLVVDDSWTVTDGGATT